VPVQYALADTPRLRAGWDPSASGQRVIHRLLQVEERYAPSLLYVSLTQQEPRRREELAQWALEVCCDCGCAEAVFPLAVSLMDRFLAGSLAPPVWPVRPLWPVCLAAGCILIASKLTECETVTAERLCAAAQHHFQPSNLRDMERVILSTLRWDTAAVTPQDFLPHFLASLEEGGGTWEPDLLSMLRRHSDTLASMCACDSRFLGTPPSLVAAASLNCALRGLGRAGPAELALLGEVLAALCRTDVAVLQCCSEMIEGALRQRLRRGLERGASEKEEEVENERPGTPTDMRDIDF
uniref:Cyclin Dx n=1 Tax=Tetraodon nigroviridis TaxID=99883 RepID=H3C0C4_TETNG